MIKKRIKPISYVNENDKVVGLGRFLKNEESPMFVDFAIGYIVETSYNEDFPLFVDKLSTKRTILPYKVFTNVQDAKLALLTNELRYGEIYCYSIYNIKTLFPELLDLYTKKEVMDYLENYNKEHGTCLNWTFMDEDEKQKLKQKQNRKYVL